MQANNGRQRRQVLLSFVCQGYQGQMEAEEASPENNLHVK